MRVKLTLLATAATAVVLLVVVSGALALFSRELRASVDAGLRTRLAGLSAAVQAGEAEQEVTAESLAELHADGQVTRSSGLARAGSSLLPAADAVDCRRAPAFLVREVRIAAHREPEPVRILARCLPGGRVLAVGESLRAQREARERLLGLLALAGPLLLAVVAVIIGRAVHAALRPVDELSRQAARISAGSDAARRLLPVRGNDEIARLAKTLDEMLGRLAAAFAREQAFVDDASHELRTPITVLRGEIELALSDLADPDGVEQSLRAALAEVERLGRLVEDLLALARRPADLGGLQSGQLIDVGALLMDAAQRLARVTALTLAVDCPADLHLRTDADHLERVLANLLTNAAAAGARTVRLVGRAVDEATASPRSQGIPSPAVLVTVEDDGPGFPPHFLPAAFDRFSRPDTAHNRPGTGLGLALVRSLVRDAGGTVTVDNASSLGGAAIRIRLPAPTPPGG